MNHWMDPLAELATAEEFHFLLAREELRRSRTGEPLAIAILDLDGLRAVNAHHGAPAGTAMLRSCAQTLRETLRAVDDLARTGPDEFSVLLHATDTESATIWADRFEDALERACKDHPAAPVTCALGLADTGDAPTLLEVAASARRRMEVVQMVRRLRRTRDRDS